MLRQCIVCVVTSMSALLGILRRGVETRYEQLLLKRHAERQARDDRRRLNDALVLRVATLESRITPEMQTLLAEWDAIAGCNVASEEKLLSLRVLYLSLAERYARTELSQPVVTAL
jgi:hypothetical protein